MKHDRTSTKVDTLIAEGDRYASKGKYDKALNKYGKAHDLEPHRKGLYEKLLDAHEKALGDRDWDREDFTRHLDWVMHQQERDYPPIKQTHAKLEPEWKAVTELAIRIVGESDDAKAAPLIEDLVAHGEIATRALIDLMRALARGRAEESDAEGAEEMT